MIWTTTPWTLPANLAIAVHPTETYTAVELDGQALVVAQPLLEAFLRLPGVKGLGAPLPLAVPGQALVGMVARHPWIDRDAPVLTADFVAMDAGTGLVHIAPGHGEEDYELGRRAGLKIYNPVDDDGRFIPEVAHFAGQTVWEANPRIIEHLRGAGALVAQVPLQHTYPHCWRCKNPTLFRATEQWFIALDQPRAPPERARRDPNEVTWIPALGRGAHLQHGGAPARLGHLAPARVGRADRRLLLRGLRGPAPRRGAGHARGRDHARRRGRR